MDEETTQGLEPQGMGQLLDRPDTEDLQERDQGAFRKANSPDLKKMITQ